jgi:flagellar basal-body rod modification protein FlgD
MADSATSMSQLSGNFNTFLTLLTTQLKNQDPTSPMDSNAFTQQLVMYSQVEQQIQSNDNLKSLITQGASNAAMLTTGYLGKKVSVTNGMASLADGAANWTYNLESAAANATMNITDKDNKIVFTGPAETSAGNHAFTWNGKDNLGNALPNGGYKLTVSAYDSANTKITTAAASAGVVSQIDMTGKDPLLVVGSMEIGLGDIAAIAN